jgi:phosphoglycerate kinase
MQNSTLLRRDSVPGEETVAEGIGKKTVRDIDNRGQKVLVRVDFNVPLEDGAITDDTRIRESLPTICYLLDAGAAVILCSHLGRPKGVEPSLSLRPVATRLGELLYAPVAFAADASGDSARASAEALQPGHVLLLENLRFNPGEEANDPEFARQLASLASVYVNDAFGTAHRAHASTEGVTHFLPAVAGLLLEKEVRYLGELIANPQRPFAAIVGGAKVSSKIEALDNLLPRLDLLLIGGGMANTFLAAQGNDMQASMVEADLLKTARNILQRASERSLPVLLPTDLIAAASFSTDADHRVCAPHAIPEGYMALDIGPATLSTFVDALQPAASVIWNGPMGVFEMAPYAGGSFGLARALADLDATTVVGGGETAAVVNEAGVADRITHVSTGGGASLEMLEGKTLPGVAALLDR